MMSEAKKRVPKRRFKEFLNTGDWEQRKLGDVADVRDGTHDSPKFYNDGFPLVTSKNLKDGSIDFSDCSFISEQDFDEINKRSKVDPGDILFGMIGTIGKPAIVEYTGFAIKNVALIKEGNIINNRFIYHLLSSKVFDNYIARENAGGTQKFIALNQIRNFIFSAPTLAEQNKIIELLDYISQIITLHQSKLDKLQATKKALLQEMFPEEGQDKPKRRFKGFSDAWEQRKLGNIVDFLDGQRKPLKESDRIKGKYPYYGASGIIDYINDYLFDENLVLLSEDGANIIDRNYPICFIATGKYWVNNHAHVLKVKAGVIDKFICESLERLDYTKFNTGTAQPKLNQDICQKIVITIPNEDEQKCISEFLDRINNIITLHQRKLDKLKNLKQAYLNEMFV